MLIIVWRITEHCNLGCSFCGYSRFMNRPRMNADPEQALAFGRLLSEYRAQYGSEILVNWLGGEPLLWEPLRNISRIFKHEFHLRTGVSTNGTTLKSAHVRKHLIDDYDQVTISIDGLGGFHDSVRGTDGLHHHLQEGITCLKEMKVRSGRGPLIRVNTILMRNNIYMFEWLCHELCQWGVEELTFNPLGGAERPDFYETNKLLPEHVCWLRKRLPELRNRMLTMGLNICGSETYLEIILNSAYGINVPVTDCNPGKHFLFIDEEGFAGPCSFTARRYGEPLIEIKTPEDLHQLPARLAQRKRVPCLDCKSNEVFGKFSSERSSEQIHQAGENNQRFFPAR